MACLEVATSGLLALVLRGLASCADALRGCAYEALGLYDEALEASDFRSALHDLHHSCNTTHCKQHALHGCNDEIPALYISPYEHVQALPPQHVRRSYCYQVSCAKHIMRLLETISYIINTYTCCVQGEGAAVSADGPGQAERGQAAPAPAHPDSCLPGRGLLRADSVRLPAVPGHQPLPPAPPCS